MKHYVKPTLSEINVVCAEALASTPWAGFASNLDELGGAITSYLFASGIEITVD